MARLPLLCLVSLIVLGGCDLDRRPERPAVLEVALWRDFAARFVDGGRVMDRDNSAITHSEGQGYGMLFAEAAGERESFDRLWHWTREHLLRDDGLLSWRWEPGRGVTDHNNASDGDILVAWALMRAAERWDNDRYRQAAVSLMAAVREQLLVERDGALYLLPGMAGFDKPDGVVINPSYYVFPALEMFAAREDSATWRRLIDDGRELFREAAVAPVDLVPDWVLLKDGEVGFAEGFPPRFSWDAVRIPLYIAWDASLPSALLRPYVKFWEGFERPPAWIDLTTGETADFPASNGVLAIAALAGTAVENRPAPRIPAPAAEDGYFSTCLILLSQIAAAERRVLSL